MVLRMLVGVDCLSFGMIEVFGKKVFEMNLEFCCNVVMVIDDFDFFFDLLVVEYFDLFVCVYGLVDVDVFVDEVFEEVQFVLQFGQFFGIFFFGQWC